MPHHNHNRWLRPLATALTLALVLLELGAALAAPRRDPDGQRRRAQKIALDTPSQDSLAAPDDLEDWRYIELDAPARLVVEVTLEPGDAPVKLAITNATGKVLAETDAGDGKRELSLKATPGIYYIQLVTAEGKADYTFSLSLK